jgi:hypothetical protein
MATWLEDIISAIENLGGITAYDDLYSEIKRIRSPLPGSWKQIIQRTIQDHSSDSDRYKDGEDIFYSVDGIGGGVWGVRTRLGATPRAVDIEPPAEPIRAITETYRILRDTPLAKKIKALHKDVCQICGTALQFGNGKTYSEAHHIRPLGTPHNGPDISGNIIILCPNHHVLFDYGALLLDMQQIRTTNGHTIDNIYIQYHNEKIFVQKPYPNSND